MTPTERLIRAWIRWEDFPASKDAVVEKLAAIAGLGMHSSNTHNQIGRMRHHGYDVPSAVQTAINELTEWKEAS